MKKYICHKFIKFAHYKANFFSGIYAAEDKKTQIRILSLDKYQKKFYIIATMKKYMYNKFIKKVLDNILCLSNFHNFKPAQIAVQSILILCSQGFGMVKQKRENGHCPRRTI